MFRRNYGFYLKCETHSLDSRTIGLFLVTRGQIYIVTYSFVYIKHPIETKLHKKFIIGYFNFSGVGSLKQFALTYWRNGALYKCGWTWKRSKPQIQNCDGLVKILTAIQEAWRLVIYSMESMPYAIYIIQIFYIKLSNTDLVIKMAFKI